MSAWLKSAPRPPARLQPLESGPGSALSFELGPGLAWEGMSATAMAMLWEGLAIKESCALHLGSCSLSA